jgi:hypothetical protein
VDVCPGLTTSLKGPRRLPTDFYCRILSSTRSHCAIATKAITRLVEIMKENSF